MKKAYIITLSVLLLLLGGTYLFLSLKPSSVLMVSEITPLERENLEGLFPPLPHEYKIVGLGDSLTKGVGDENSEGYIGYVADHYFKDSLHGEPILKNFAVTGNKTDDLLKRLQAKKVQKEVKEADFIFITIGGNDLMGVVKNNFLNLDRDLFTLQKKVYLENLEKALTDIRDMNAEVPVYLVGVFNPFSKVFGEIPEINDIVNEWNAGSKQVTGEFENVNFVPIYDLFEESEINLLYDDAFHPNGAGYERIGERVIEHLEEKELARH
ncbi:SGNH/GDSL hydrolase family protein [Pseudalkalibacillus caeni]|uniref:GDSL family lipase n=1 Tax=Exobacillus caeni TaxID=2574798 RepID=A0A5R9F357_9BACL|nr:SGNH/GDSL hydrolase family protein [Pseudalkalibacillus caeni]TLS37451.1 GDSL family lipase [Pseudalkalibacillus caeni]